MPLTHMACTHCGHWHLWFEGGVPPQCLVCSDVRNALPEDGFEFHGIERVASQVRSQRNEVLPGVWGVRCEPAYGLGSVGWIIERADGNVAFEAAAFLRPRCARFYRLARWPACCFLLASARHGRAVATAATLRADRADAGRCAAAHQGVARELAHAFANGPAMYWRHVERQLGEGMGLLAALAARACVVVGDDLPCFMLPHMLAAAAHQNADPFLT